jgi:hypothetical protein
MPPHRDPEMQQLMTAQTKLMHMMDQFMANMNNYQNNNNNQNNDNPPQVDNLTKFLRLRPDKFSSAPEPMIALDWLQAVSKDLVTIGCTDAKK